MNGGSGLLERAISYAARSARDITPALLPCPTPCRGWNLDMLLRHASESLAALHDGTATGQVSLIPAAPCHDPAGDPARTFQDRAVRLLAARATASCRHQVLDIGDLPLPAIAMECAGAIEIAVHGWDISRRAAGTGRSRTRWPDACWRSPHCSFRKPADTPCSAHRSRHQLTPARATGSSPTSAASPRHHGLRQITPTARPSQPGRRLPAARASPRAVLVPGYFSPDTGGRLPCDLALRRFFHRR
jgi:hypothetical protein